METKTGAVAVCTAVVLAFAVLVGGPASCIVSYQREATRQIQAACQGDLHADAARSAACTLALMKR